MISLLQDIVTQQGPVCGFPDEHPDRFILFFVGGTVTQGDCNGFLSFKHATQLVRAISNNIRNIRHKYIE